MDHDMKPAENENEDKNPCLQAKETPLNIAITTQGMDSKKAPQSHSQQGKAYKKTQISLKIYSCNSNSIPFEIHYCCVSAILWSNTNVNST